MISLLKHNRRNRGGRFGEVQITTYIYKMIVKELIEYLQTVDPELKVFIKGYEAGYNDVNTFNNE